ANSSPYDRPPDERHKACEHGDNSPNDRGRNADDGETKGRKASLNKGNEQADHDPGVTKVGKAFHDLPLMERIDGKQFEGLFHKCFSVNEQEEKGNEENDELDD